MTLYEILTAMTTSQKNNLSSPLWTAAEFEGVVLDYFEEREYIKTRPTENETVSRFLVSYTRWKTLMNDNLTRAKAVLDEEYAPLENYSSSETSEKKNTGTVGNTESGTNTGTQTSTDTLKNVTSTTSAGGTTENGQGEKLAYTFGGNGSSPMPDSKENNTTTGGTTSEASGSSTSQNSGSITRTDNLADSRTGTRTDNLTEKFTKSVHGNMSMRSTQDFLLQELEVRKTNYIKDFINLFVDSVTIWG